MVYMIKNLDDVCAHRTNEVFIRYLTEEDIMPISGAFNQIGWNKPKRVFEKYLKEIEQGEALVWVARVHDQFAGYIILKWQSRYSFFKKQNIP